MPKSDMSSTTISATVLEQFRAVTKMISGAHIRSGERAKAAHERFNIFIALLKNDGEVRLHTRFLHCLLNPKGCHDCGPLFLDLFFTTLVNSPGLDHNNKIATLEVPPANEDWRVRKEVPCPPYGQIDLLFERPGFKIAIENKIKHDEEPRQLARYSEYLRKRPDDKTWLIYLTKDGKTSATHEGAAYIRISYSKHILTWLDECLRKSYRMIPINQGLLQYREVVRYITGKSLESTNMKPIAKFITQYPDIIRFRKQLDQGIEEAVANFFDRLADEIKEELHEFQVRSHERKFGVDSNGALVITTPNLPFEIFLEYDTSDTNEKVLAVGISFDKAPPSKFKRLFERMYEELKRNADAAGCDQSHKTDDWPTGWRNLIEGLDDEGLAKLLQRRPSKIVSEMCERIRSYINLLDQIFKQLTKV